MTLPKRPGSLPIRSNSEYKIAVGVRKSTRADEYTLRECQVARSIIAAAAKAKKAAK